MNYNLDNLSSNCFMMKCSNKNNGLKTQYDKKAYKRDS